MSVSTLSHTLRLRVVILAFSSVFRVLILADLPNSLATIIFVKRCISISFKVEWSQIQMKKGLAYSQPLVHFIKKKKVLYHFFKCVLFLART